MNKRVLRYIIFCIITSMINHTMMSMQVSLPYKSVDLLSDDAALLKYLLGLEADGYYCRNLIQAENTLNKLFKTTGKEGSFSVVLNMFEDEALTLAGYVAQRKTDKSALLDACITSDIDAIKEIARKNPYVVQAYDRNNHWTILHYALAKNLSLSVVETLLSLGSCVKARTGISMQSPLHFALTSSAAELLIKYKADVNQTNDRGETALWRNFFLLSSNTSVIDCLLKHRADLNCLNAQGDTMLHCALAERVMSLKLATLLKYPFDLYRYNRRKVTVLEYAFRHNVLHLLERFNIKYIPYNSEILSSIHVKGKHLQDLYAAESLRGHYDLVFSKITELFLMLNNVKPQVARDGIVKRRDGYLFQNASLSNFSNIVGIQSVKWMRRHIMKRCNSFLSVYSFTLFHSAWPYAHLYLLKYDKNIAFQIFKRMMHGQDPWRYLNLYRSRTDGRDKNGDTLIHCAVRCDNLYGITYFVEKKVDFTLKNNNGLTAFDIAAGQKKETLSHLLSRVVDFVCYKKPNEISQQQKDFLSEQLAVDHKNSKMDVFLLQELCRCPEWLNAAFELQWMNLLLARNPHINKEDLRGITLLTRAIEAEHKKAILLLLAHGGLVENKMLNGILNKKIKTIVEDAYNSQECCICFEHTDDLANLPCAFHHPKTYVCNDCNNCLAGKDCPICRTVLPKSAAH